MSRGPRDSTPFPSTRLCRSRAPDRRRARGVGALADPRARRPLTRLGSGCPRPGGTKGAFNPQAAEKRVAGVGRSEEHTSELQSRQYLVCRLLLEKKKVRYYL